MNQDFFFCELEYMNQDALPETTEAAIFRIMKKAMQMEGLPSGHVCVVIADDAFLHDLNRKFRGVDRATDVLSFPANDFSAPYHGLSIDLASLEREENRIFLGDIYISLSQAQRQAEEIGQSAEKELQFLALHGTLHLMGYDHIKPEEEAIMIAQQEKIRSEL